MISAEARSGSKIRSGENVVLSNSRGPSLRGLSSAQFKLAHPEPFTDKYFLRTKEILAALDINPWVKAQVIVRAGPGISGGIQEAARIISDHSLLLEHGGRIRVAKDGAGFAPGEALMTIEGPIQDFVALETVYLGVISAATTRATDVRSEIDLEAVEKNMRAVVSLAGGRPVIYMGSRHWHWNEDAAISAAAFSGGASECSTDIGAKTVGKKGIGTIPHVLENIMASIHGKDRAVVEATLAFDRVIDPAVRRIALIDYNNKEITDSLATARALGSRLFGVRVDTCGENVAEGALRSAFDPLSQARLWKDVPLPADESADARYWYGSGVTVTGVYALRKALDEAGFSSVKIVLSSGFADTEKVAAFTRAEKLLNVKLFDMLGVGGIFPSRSAKMDIVRVGTTAAEMKPISKAGRKEVDSSGLREWMK